MNLTLTRFGSNEVEIDPSTLIEFPIGLPGFDDCKRFKLFHSEDNPSVFWLQSIDDLEVVFALTDPDLLKVSYNLTLTDEEESVLRIAAEDELQLAVILSQQAEAHATGQSTIQPNLRSPIVINVTRQLALQKPLCDTELPIRH